MSYFAVLRDAGPAWSDRGITAQPAVDDHAQFMHTLAEEGFVLIAGPLAGTEQGRLRALLIVDAADEEEIRPPCRRSVDGLRPAPNHEHRALERPRRCQSSITQLALS